MVNNTNTTSSEKKDSALEFAKVLENAKKSGVKNDKFAIALTAFKLGRALKEKEEVSK